MEEEYNPYPNYDASVSGNEEASDVHKWIADVEKEKDKLIHKIKGEIWDYKIQEWKKDKQSEAWGNRKLISTVDMFFDNYISKPIVYSNISQEEIDKICKIVGKGLLEDFADNWKDYGLTTTRRNMLYDQLHIMLWAFLTRAKNEGERSLFKKVQYSIQRLYKNPDNKVSSMSPFGRG